MLIKRWLSRFVIKGQKRIEVWRRGSNLIGVLQPWCQRTKHSHIRFVKHISQNIISIRTSRVKLFTRPLLQRCKLRGIALPSFRRYYWHAHIHKTFYWLESPNSPRCRLEALSCTTSSLSALLYSLPMKIKHYTDNPAVLSTIQIWQQFRHHFNFLSVSTLAPVCSNHLFPSSSLDCTFSHWYRKGITFFLHVDMLYYIIDLFFLICCLHLDYLHSIFSDVFKWDAVPLPFFPVFHHSSQTTLGLSTFFRSPLKSIHF